MSVSGEGSGRPRVVIVDADAEVHEWLGGALGDRFALESHRSGAAAAAALAGREPAVLIAGERLDDGAGARFLAERLEAGDLTALFVGPAEAAPERVFYVLDRSLGADDVCALVEVAARQVRQRDLGAEPPPELSTAGEAARVQRQLEVFRRLAMQRDLAGAAGVAVEAVIEFTGADRARCLYHDAEGGALWVEGEGDEEYVATAGLAGFAARTGRSVSAAAAAGDGRYRAAIDDPAGDGTEHLLVQAVVGTDRQVHAVLVAVRLGHRPDFEPGERRALAELAEQWAPLVHQLSREVEAESVLAAARERAGGMFRSEAVAAAQSRRQQGDVVRVSPAWVSWSYWLLVGVLVAAGVYAGVGRIDQYSAGPALVRSSGRAEITAPTGGSVQMLAVEPGQRVEAGQLLARLHDTAEAAELERVEDEWQVRLREYLFAPADESARRALATLRAEREQARARLEDRVLRAPHTGVVSDVRARVGQHLDPGDILMTVVSDATDLFVIALIPGADRPQIHPGMPMRLELYGYRYAYQKLTVDTVADEVIGPGEARRYLGQEVADAVPIEGSVVLVTARLPRSTFTADGEVYRYHDGMVGLAEVRIRSERIITAIIPALERL